MFAAPSLQRRSLLLKHLTCAFPSGSAFLEGVRMSEGLASFRYTPERDFPPEMDIGSVVELVVVLRDSERTFRVHGRVIKRKPTGETRGIRFEFLRDELVRQELLLLAAKGESIPYRRRAHERFACALSATFRTADEERVVEVKDVSMGGFRLAIESDALVDVGTSGRLELEGEVVPAHVVGTIPHGPARGICCEWSLRSSDQRRAIEAIVRSVRE